MLHQSFAIHKPRPHRLALTEKLLRLIVPVSAFFVITRAQRYHCIRLRGIGHEHDLRRSLTPMPDHFFSYRPKTGGTHSRHPGFAHRPASQWVCASSTLSANSEIFAVWHMNRAEFLLQPISRFVHCVKHLFVC